MTPCSQATRTTHLKKKNIRKEIVKEMNMKNVNFKITCLMFKHSVMKVRVEYLLF